MPTPTPARRSRGTPPRPTEDKLSETITPTAPNPAPSLSPYRAAMIGELTTRAHALHDELIENLSRVDALQSRCAVIRRELTELNAKVREHAWNGCPLD